MEKVSQIWFNIQGILFPFIEKEIEEPLTEKLKQLVATLELIWIEDFVHIPDYWHGQSPMNRKPIARPFVAKAVYNMTTTRELIDRLKTTPVLYEEYAGGKEQGKFLTSHLFHGHLKNLLKAE